MEIEIKNFRGISSARIPLDRHVLIAGPNGAGKTSFSMAVAAACSGNAAPWADVKAKEARALLRDGASRGHVSLITGETRVTVNYPGGSVTGEAPFSASPVALGMVSVATMKPAEAATTLGQYMDARPTLDDLVAAIGQSAATRAWETIETSGWDAALARAKDTCTRLKGQWDGVTGEHYGSVKSQDWQPEGAEDFDLTGDLAGDVAQAKAHLHAVLANQSADPARLAELEALVAKGEAAHQWLEANGLNAGLTNEHYRAELESLRLEAKRASDAQAQTIRLENLKALADRLPDLNSSMQVIEGLLNTARLDANRRRDELALLPRPTDIQPLAQCPRCSTHLIVQSRSVLIEPEHHVSLPENEVRKAAYTEAQQRVTEANSVVADREQKLNALQGEVARAEAAQQEVTRENKAHKGPGLDETLARINLLSQAGQYLSDRDHASRAASELSALRAKAGSSPDDVAQAHQLLAEAEQALSIKQAIDQAATLARQIGIMTGVVTALEPGGVRQTVLTRALSSFNSRLAEICAVAHWNTVEVTDSMRIAYGGRDYGWQLSESEKFRVRIALQLVMSAIDGSPFVLVDAADILDRKGRNGLVALLNASERPLLMTMTLNTSADVPNLSAFGVSAFWINESGVIAPT